VRAGADQAQPLGLAGLVPIRVLLRIGHGRIVVLHRRGDLHRLAVADEQRLAAPLHDHLLARRHLGQVELDRRQRQRVGRRIELVDERPDEAAHGAHSRRAGGDVDEVATARVVA